MRSFVTLVSSLLAFAMATATHAALITLSFSGTVNNVVDYSGAGYVPAGIHDGSPFTATVTFNNLATARSTDATDAYYSGTDLDMNINVIVAGQYQYTIATPDSSDEIDLEGSAFDLIKRGPTVYTAFAPNPPFSHLDVELQTDTDVLSNLSNTDITLGSTPLVNISDAQTTGAGYYDIGAVPTSLPEPSHWAALLLFAPGLVLRRQVGRRFSMN